MITVTARLVAIAFALLAGAGIVALGVFGAVRNGLTPREVALGCIAIVVGAVAALWLRMDKLRGRRP